MTDDSDLSQQPSRVGCDPNQSGQVGRKVLESPAHQKDKTR